MSDLPTERVTADQPPFTEVGVISLDCFSSKEVEQKLGDTDASSLVYQPEQFTLK